jgi:drug/metabolite transporter (DMT)-like permease
MVPPIPSVTHSMTIQNKPGAKAHITPAGLMFLAITSVGWGFNWPVTKYLLSELPPLTLRGSTGVIGAGLLAVMWGLVSHSGATGLTATLCTAA